MNNISAKKIKLRQKSCLSFVAAMVIVIYCTIEWVDCCESMSYFDRLKQLLWKKTGFEFSSVVVARKEATQENTLSHCLMATVLNASPSRPYLRLR